ncbi:Carbonic anhydrase 2 [Frondihabitans sp. 762G35]|uniref:carbonic anhydrase n=1 Tax=Frondihabitans sp. 762G35 TaxID=1446794 RepID=UPI000D225149|nr:carbonic anhydrase [Frondihabitans sp. 762G35]ARC56232.1 Carbonic anhydrase 2 [Frondihabitans sp. 762G35]
MTTTDITTPGDAWSALLKGNERFVEGRPEHPRQDADRRALLAQGQQPIAALFGCSDSRLAAEIIFDAGLGDLFVVRNAGQVVGEEVLGTLEFAVGQLGIPLIVVLGHDSCGAVAGAIQSIDADSEPASFYLQRLIDMIVPSVKSAHRALADGADRDAPLDPREVGRLHIEASVTALLGRSPLISEAVASGRLAVVGANYDLANGRVDPHTVVGTL